MALNLIYINHYSKTNLLSTKKSLIYKKATIIIESLMFNYRPEKIIIDKKVCSEPLTKQLCEQFSDIPKKIVDNYDLFV